MSNYFHILEGLGYPINININFNNIGFYRYNNNIKLINFQNDLVRRGFESFIRHPLIYLNLELIFKTTTVDIDLISNLTTHPTNKVGYFTINSINFVNDPSMVFERGEFLKNFTMIKGQNSFKLQSGICSSIDFQKKMLSFVENDKWDNGIFIQKGNFNNLVIKKIPKLLFNCKF